MSCRQNVRGPLRLAGRLGEGQDCVRERAEGELEKLPQDGD